MTLLSALCGPANRLQAAEAATELSGEEAVEFFEKHVRPVLVNRCYECHSGNSDEPKGSLRVDSRAALLAGGDTGPAIVPGDAKQSLLIDAINYGDLYEMPPKSKLPDKEIAALTRWVELGAPWPGGDSPITTTPPKENEFDLAKRRASHWCWQPIEKPAPPVVVDNAWPREALDRFILARLESAGLKPAEQTDRATLLRRVTFDLTGLPPTPAELHAFMSDDSPLAYERVVDRLLASPRFGERWGRHWLDLVRYAESRGHEFDYNIPNVWHYRDYVIRALNADVPYDRFVTEHVAGDLLAEPRLDAVEGSNESILGTGFWFLGEWVHSPVDIRQDECDRFDNMVDVFGKTFLGLTIGCARCHDHKFDAIAQADYYALTGYLQSSAYRQARFDSEAHNRRIARQLAALDREAAPHITAAVLEQYKDVVARMEGYLLAAREVLVSGASPRTPKGKEQLARSAEKYGVDAQRLAAWTAHLRAAENIEDDPLHGFARLALDAPDETVILREPIDQLRTAWTTELEQNASQREQLDMVVDFGTLRDSDWIADGLTFGLGPRRAGELQLSTDGDAPLAEVVEYGGARRDPLWNGLKLTAGTEPAAGRLSRYPRAGRTVRTPTFEIRRKSVFYLVRGTGHAYAVVDSHRMINGPLHGSLLKDIKTGGALTWIGHDLSRYHGHGAHMEFIATGDEPLEVLMVVQSDSPPGDLLEGPNRLLLASLDKSAEATISDAAHRWQQAFAKAYLALQRGELASHPLNTDAARLLNWVLRHPELCRTTDERSQQRVRETVAEYRRQRDALTSQIKWESRTAPAMWDGDAQNEHLLIRGNPKTAGDLVPRGMPVALGGPRSDSNYLGSGRRALAQQLTDPQNPLVARVIVNRLWHHLFGRGLSAAVDNFGVLGTEPTHPELLDYLAGQFVRDDWSQKRMIRRLVLSSTYRMASTGDAHSEEADPANLLVHRRNVRRLEAEPLRDTLLSLSGRLDNRMYGKSVDVFLTPFMQGRGRPPQGPLDGNGRRSIYISIRRNFLSPMMLAFDTPQPFNTVGRRNVSNVPAQALTLMNDPLVIELAGMWAERVLADETSTTDDRLTAVYETAFSRPPTDDECAAAMGFLETQGQEYGLSPQDAQGDERVWTDLCHVLINAKEFIFIN
ncbi:MAG: PSD1 and planctomycete cytochrome C domain-containing protein [Pirellulaceae bacterium]